MIIDTKIAVIASVYNEKDLIAPFIRSMCMQTLKPTTVVIVDDRGVPGEFFNKEERGTMIRYCRDYGIILRFVSMPRKEKPDLDTVGRAFNLAWWFLRSVLYDYIALFDPDSTPDWDYFEKIVVTMKDNPDLVCASGELRTNGIEKANIGFYMGRKDARGCGKLVDVKFLETISDDDFPDVAWDTWINTRAKVEKKKAKQVSGVYFHARPTTRVQKRDLFRSGRLSYHFGYNPFLVLLKVLLAGTGGVTLAKGYLDARKRNWKLPDEKVRKYFGWRFLLHPLR